MPICVYWGDDDFAIARAVEALRLQTLDAAWSSFNYDKISPDQPDSVIQGLNQAMTPPFGAGKRLVWLVDSPLLQRCPEDWLVELEHTLPKLSETSVLLLTGRSKPDGRLKSTKLLQKFAEIREFPVIPPWKADLLLRQVRQAAQETGVSLTPDAAEMLATAVGSNTRLLYSELEKLRLFVNSTKRAIDADAIAQLVTANAQNTLQLGSAVRQGDVAQTLDLLADLLRQNEPALMIVKSLVGQFRTWVWVKLMLEAGERDDGTIAQAAELSNPKRLYFLKKEVERLSSVKLLQTLPILLELESSLKSGADEVQALQTRLIQLCEVCRNG